MKIFFRRKKAFAAGIGLVLSALLLAPAAHAKSLTWTGGGANNYWDNYANWGGLGAPANGDFLTFPAGAARLMNTNNLTNLRLAGITFGPSALNYAIYGNSLTLSNSFTLLYTTGTNSFYPAITLGTPLSLDFAVASPTATFYCGGNIVLGSFGLTINNSGFVQLDCSISGSGGVTKGGYSGTLSFYGQSLLGKPNSYTGTTYVHGGTLELNKWHTASPPGPAIAIAGNLWVGTGGTNTEVVRLLRDDQIADSAHVTTEPQGLLDLNGHRDTIGALTMVGGRITNSSAGLLTLTGDVAADSFSYGAYPGAEIYGPVSLNGTNRTFTVFNGYQDNDLILWGEVRNGGIIKQGPGTLLLTVSNSYDGLTLVNEGNLSILNTWALGSTNNGTVIAGSGAASGGLWVGGDVIAGDIQEPLTMGGLASWLMFDRACNWSGPVTLTNAVDIYCTESNYTATISGSITGSGGFTKYGPGILRLGGLLANTYSGDTLVNEGELQLAKTNAITHGTLTIGDGWGGRNADVVRELTDRGIGDYYLHVLIRSSGLLDLNNHYSHLGPFYLDGGNISTGAAGLLSLGNPLYTYTTAPTNGASSISGNLRLYLTTYFYVTNTLNVSANISCPDWYQFMKLGPGTMNLYGSNSYAGWTYVGGGKLVAYTPWALGTTNEGTRVGDGASLVLYQSAGITNEALELRGAGAAADWGALDSEVAGALWVGAVTVNADSTIAAWNPSSQLRIIGPISGPGGITQIGSGTLSFEGNSANTYAGDTRVNSGTLVLNKSVVDGAIPGNLIIGDGLGGANADVVRLDIGNQIANTSDVTINSSGLLQLGPHLEAVDELRGTGNLTTDTYLGLGYGNGSSAFDGVISGAGALRKEGSGTITLNGASPFAGSTTVANGTLVVHGSLSQSPVTVLGSGTLAGRGTVGTLIANGNVSPGASPGILTSSNLAFSALGNFYVELTGPTPGTDYDQLNVRGTNNLGNATLHVTPAFTRPVSIGDQFVILNNDGTESITGTFNGLANGATFSAGGFGFRINYNAGTGNDVVLTVTDVPLAPAGSAITTGNGNHVLDRYECDLLALVLSNRTATPMTGVTATLSSPTPGVMITQPYSDYPDVPAMGGGTNVTPFQIATLLSFPCGADANLELSIRSASHGSFVVPAVLHSGEPSLSPWRYDVSLVTNIPDVGAIESTNVVTGFSGPLMKVVVSMWLTHPVDADLNIALVSPDGVVVDLSSGNGAGANFGAACSPDTSRTTFDDAAATPITAGSPPFMDTFRPEGSLASFIYGPANGPWRLRVSDNLGGTLGALRCWSLFLCPVQCAPGSGFCSVCLPGVSGDITATDPVQNGRIYCNAVHASCGSPKAWPGSVATNFHYDVHTFTNLTAADACVTVQLQAGSGLQAATYLDSFDPTNILSNYLGDSGESTRVGVTVTTFSCAVPAGARFLVTVNEVASNSGTRPYTLYLSGLPCPTPSLAIAPVAGPDKVRIHWPTWAGNYQLRSQTSLTGPAWDPTPEEPIVNAGRFTVTNTTAGTNRFYRLYRLQ